MSRNDLIRTIHVLKRDLALDEDTYRHILMSVAGKQSCTEMQDEELNLVLMSMRKVRGDRVATGRIANNPQQQKFIARLMDHLKWSWSNTAHFCERVTGKKSTRVCSAAELSKVIRGMIAIIDHDLNSGKIVMNHTERFEYERHAGRHREKKPA